MRHLVLVCVLVLLCLASRPATAEEPAEGEGNDSYAPMDDPRRAEVEPLLAAPASLWISAVASIGLEEQAVRGAGMLVLGGTFEDVVRGRELRVSAAQAKTGDEDGDKRDPTPAAASSLAGHAEIRALVSRPHRGRLARGAVRAALAAAGTAKASERIDDAASRARWSGLVPELRLRVAQVVDEDQALAPTEYDPERVTASGGTSLWMEGRATFRLDRLVFADDEVALERVRTDHAKLDRELMEDVLRSFGVWQRAEARLGSEPLDDATRASLEVDLAVEEARLDALTDGWFVRALADDPASRADDQPPR